MLYFSECKTTDIWISALKPEAKKCEEDVNGKYYANEHGIIICVFVVIEYFNTAVQFMADCLKFSVITLKTFYYFFVESV